jgi:hypothetical protein
MSWADAVTNKSGPPIVPRKPGLGKAKLPDIHLWAAAEAAPMSDRFSARLLSNWARICSSQRGERFGSTIPPCAAGELQSTGSKASRAIAVERARPSPRRPSRSWPATVLSQNAPFGRFAVLPKGRSALGIGGLGEKGRRGT